ncbi:hypothetical protein [Streptomyces sp. NPDC059850]|uniref:hypothetical protein n=1 Tax=Streptomyces sp. NPDC059850 TaxID=3346970 RepID=UPI003654DEB3
MAKCEGGVDFLGMFSDPVGEMIGVVARYLMNAAYEVIGTSMGTPSENQDVSADITRQTQWIVVYLSIGSMLFAATKMALDRRGEPGQTMVKGILRIVVVSTSASVVVNLFVRLMNNYSDHLLQGATEDLRKGMGCDGHIESMLLLVIAGLMLLSGLLMAVLMWVRLGVEIILMGTLPVAAAASMTDWGQTWWRKHIGWLVAWLLYKPTVALIIWSGTLMMTGAKDDQASTQIAGMAVLLLTAIALPALMRVVVPATGALGGDSVGQTTMGIASGALQSVKSGGGSSGPQGPSGASGASPSGAGSRGGGAAAGGGRAAAAAGGPAAVAIVAAQKAGAAAKTVADVARSGVDTPDREQY